MNIVDIQFSNAGVQVAVHHNNTVVATVPADGNTHRIELSTLPNQNSLVLSHSGETPVEIISIEMFGMGRDKLRYLGIFNDANGSTYQSHLIDPGGSWILNYDYPVFTWLHEVLHLGWLIKPDYQNV